MMRTPYEQLFFDLKIFIGIVSVSFVIMIYIILKLSTKIHKLKEKWKNTI